MILRMRIKRVACVVAGLALAAGLAAQARAQTDRSTYSVSVLGDVHYEAPPLERFHKPGKSGLFRGNTLMWEKDMPGLLAASALLYGGVNPAQQCVGG